MHAAVTQAWPPCGACAGQVLAAAAERGFVRAGCGIALLDSAAPPLEERSSDVAAGMERH
jgi:hypothetical protein